MQRKGMITQLRLGRVVTTRGIVDVVPTRELLAALRHH